MSDLISRRAAIDAVIDADYKDCGVLVERRCRKFEEALRSLPAAQPEIIRCKDCKYAEVADPEDSQDGYSCQFHQGSIWFSGSYCSWAERREG